MSGEENAQALLLSRFKETVPSWGWAGEIHRIPTTAAGAALSAHFSALRLPRSLPGPVVMTRWPGRGRRIPRWSPAGPQK